MLQAVSNVIFYVAGSIWCYFLCCAQYLMLFLILHAVSDVIFSVAGSI